MTAYTYMESLYCDATIVILCLWAKLTSCNVVVDQHAGKTDTGVGMMGFHILFEVPYLLIIHTPHSHKGCICVPR